jgi:hypothetical protein
MSHATADDWEQWEEMPLKRSLCRQLTEDGEISDWSKTSHDHPSSARVHCFFLLLSIGQDFGNDELLIVKSLVTVR